MPKGIYLRSLEVRNNMRVVNKLPSRLGVVLTDEQKKENKYK